MAILKKKLRMVVAQNSYRKASQLRQMLVLAEYEQRHIFEVIDGDEFLQILQEEAPIHLAMLTPVLLTQLEKTHSLHTLYAQFPAMSLLLLGEEDDGASHGSGKILPDSILMPPVTADTLESGITLALQNHERRILAMRHVEQGETALQQGLSTVAQTHFDAALQIGNRDPYVCYILGDLFERTADTEQAIAAFTQAWERDPTYFAGIHRIVNICLSQGEGRRAIPYLERAVNQGSAPVEALAMLGTLYLEEGDTGKARLIFKAACGMHAARAMSALVEQAGVLLQRQGSAAAITLLQIGREVQPEHAQVYELLGDLFTEQQQLKEALSCYETLLRLSDPLPGNYCRLAKTYLALGYPLRADKAVREALRLDQDYAEALRLRTAILDRV
jgi:tetratricopeptide (TPR) repeat protein